MYYIRKIELYTKNYGRSVLDFKSGLNIIYGPSNTGKSLILECIDFMFGGKCEKLTDSPVGFSMINMELDVDGQTLLLSREIGSNDVKVDSNVIGIDDGIYKTGKTKKNTSQLWLRLMGIDDEVQVIQKLNYSPQTLGVRTFIHSFLIKESRMVADNSILKSGEGYNSNIPVPTVSSLIYMATGKNFLENHKAVDKKYVEAKNQAVEMFVDRSLKSLAAQRMEALDGDVTETDATEIKKRIAELLEEIDVTQDTIQSEVMENQNLTDKIVDIDNQTAECKMLKNRYSSLMTQYESDIRRLTFIAEGDLHKNILPKLDHCPFCNGELPKDKETSCIDAAIAEVDKIEAQINDLRSAFNEIDAEITNLAKEKIAVVDKRKEIQNCIRIELKPKIQQLKDMVASYRVALGRTKVNEMFDKFEYTLNTELLESLSTDAPEKFDVRGALKDYMSKTLDANLLRILRATNYENIDSAFFDIEKCDVKVNGTGKATQGKGFKAFLNTVMAIAVQEYLEEKNLYQTHLLAIDSPVLSLVEKRDPDDKEATDVMKKGLFEYFVSHSQDRQMIVVENYIPDIDYKDANIIQFTKSDEDRYGLIEGYRK